MYNIIPHYLLHILFVTKQTQVLIKCFGYYIIYCTISSLIRNNVRERISNLFSSAGPKNLDRPWSHNQFKEATSNHVLLKWMIWFELLYEQSTTTKGIL